MSNCIKEYKLNISNVEYIIYLKTTDNGEDSSIVLEARNKSFYYQSIYNLNELMMLSKAFRFCDNINEALNIISKIFDKKSYLKKGNSDDELYLFLKINLPSGEEQEIKLILNKIESTENLSKEELLQKITFTKN